MSDANNLAGVWKQGATQLATVVLAMAGFWLVEGREYTTRNEVSSMIEKDAPYTRDRQLILNRLTETAEVNKELSKAIVDLRVAIAEMRSDRNPGN